MSPERTESFTKSEQRRVARSEDVDLLGGWLRILDRAEARLSVTIMQQCVRSRQSKRNFLGECPTSHLGLLSKPQQGVTWKFG